jgi:hypothetical protein
MSNFRTPGLEEKAKNLVNKVRSRLVQLGVEVEDTSWDDHHLSVKGFPNYVLRVIEVGAYGRTYPSLLNAKFKGRCINGVTVLSSDTVEVPESALVASSEAERRLVDRLALLVKGRCDHLSTYLMSMNPSYQEQAEHLRKVFSDYAEGITVGSGGLRLVLDDLTLGEVTTLLKHRIRIKGLVT